MNRSVGLAIVAMLPLVLAPVLVRADDDPGPTAPAVDVEQGFPPSDSEDNAPPAAFVRTQAGPDGEDGAASGEPEGTASASDDDEGMPPSDSQDSVPPGTAPLDGHH